MCTVREDEPPDVLGTTSKESQEGLKECLKIHHTIDDFALTIKAMTYLLYFTIELHPYKRINRYE
jgi:hypothetical protein